MKNTIRTIIIEDEPLAADRLLDLLKGYSNATVEVIDTAESIAEAVAAIDQHQPDLLLCDIRLADGLSFNIWSETTVNCPVIFTTAYEEYALRAFKLNSIDYLLKPIKSADLFAALDQYLNTKATPTLLTPELIAQVAAAIRLPTYRDRFMSQINDRLIPLSVDNIAFFNSSEKITWAYNLEGRKYPIDHTLGEIERELNPQHFFRINRAFIVKHLAVKQLIAYSNSRYRVDLAGYDGKDLVIVARDRVGDFREWLSR